MNVAELNDRKKAIDKELCVHVEQLSRGKVLRGYIRTVQIRFRVGLPFFFH